MWGRESKTGHNFERFFAEATEDAHAQGDILRAFDDQCDFRRSFDAEEAGELAEQSFSEVEDDRDRGFEATGEHEGLAGTIAKAIEEGAEATIFTEKGVEAQPEPVEGRFPFYAGSDLRGVWAGVGYHLDWMNKFAVVNSNGGDVGLIAREFSFRRCRAEIWLRTKRRSSRAAARSCADLR